MYKNIVYSNDKIVYLDEYKKSSIHQKRQQEQSYKKYEKKRNKKHNNSKELSFNIISFVVILLLVGLLCLGAAYYFNSKNYTYKAEISKNSFMVKR